jgi:tRNA nucleotidyltransferase/poly(A) polymerase
MQIPCTEKELSIFNKISAAAAEMHVPSYVIGGFVRDKLLGRDTKDMDIVSTGDGIQLAHAVAAHFHPHPPVTFFKNFGTAHIRVGDMDIEFVGARKESYRAESRNPEVEPGTIEEDQLRRDFTINAMAISLQREDYGRLIDPFEGMRDLEKQLIRTR